MTTETDRTRSTEIVHRIGGLRTVAYYATVVTLIGLMGVFLGDTLEFLFTAWLVDEPGTHHLHELALVVMLWTVLVGLIVQLYKPERRVAAIQQKLLVNIVITGANLLTGFFFPPALILGGLLFLAFELHPAGWDVLRVQTAGRASPLMTATVLLAAIPLAVYGAEQYALHSSGDIHAQLGHYADMITYSLLILLLGLLASLKSIGWRVPVWSAAGLAGVLGASSMLHPNLASSTGVLWGGLAILWGVGFIVAGEMSQRNLGPLI